MPGLLRSPNKRECLAYGGIVVVDLCEFLFSAVVTLSLFLLRLGGRGGPGTL